ncbi:gamma-glutamyltranspeptidase [Nitratireductor indicus C115]|uniref:Glutathione hydrolase proenzyme n=1 Tax=Nitratireductor indicus C115 TaxID=1231190 RepID=K2NQP2_9HYPH|nr:gamma-glutamyltransferase [Nitratireductor indicus]EKF40149.1 gamma-glutamyltranspeptidase [Nitratireductor indicus C115]SFQ81404.1 gamma-glutamyltranspeptidase / glutathione hydrolase [Nitratireductor indicus]
MSDKEFPFTCEKQPASGALSVVVTNSPMGTAAGNEMLAAGGNAIDAAVAALLTLTVVEPMMVGIAGGGVSHIRLADGRHVVIDALSSAGAAMHPTMFAPVSDMPGQYMDTVDRRNLVGPSAVAVPGNLRGWCLMQEKYGKLPFADVVEPAIRAAARGFTVSHYLNGAIREHQADLAADPEIARLMLPGGNPAEPGSRMEMGAYAESLRLVQVEGAAALHGGALGEALVERLQTGGPEAGVLTLDDLVSYRAMEREAIFGTYRGHTIAGPPPPASSGVHVVEMLNILENFDVARMGFGSVQSLALLAETIRIAFEDRRAASGDPEFIEVPVERYTSKEYARACLERMNQTAVSGHAPYESRDTTHVTVADRDGNVVAATHTINGLFGARIMVPGTGIIPNNYMLNYDPRPGKAMSIAPGKRVPTSMAPMIVLKDGKPAFALGLPGGVRIFPSAMQAIVNLIDHGMDIQQAVEAPRLWTEGHHIELEPAYAPMEAALAARGYEVRLVKTVGGGMNAIAFCEDGMKTGAACWRADGTVMAQSGGLARPGVRFHI